MYGDRPIPQMEPLFGEEERLAVCRYMEEGGYLTEYRLTAEFERRIAEFTGARHCVVVNNGTISLTLAAIAVGLKAGDEVLVPNFTMIATPNSVAMIGAVPRFVDVERDTLCMDVEAAKAAITRRTKALMLVSANGRTPMAGFDAFEELAARHELVLIEDAAQSLGSYYPDGTHVGLKGVAGSFSFSAPKIISTGQGGALVTNDDEVARRLRLLKDFGRAKGGIDTHEAVGFNAKFTELQAAVGLAQMDKLQARILRKREIYRRYREALSELSPLALFDHDLSRTTPWFVDILAEDRARLVESLQREGIGTRLMYPPINAQEAYRVPGAFPVSEMVGERGLWLPSSIQLGDADIQRVCAAVAAHYRA